MKRFKFRRRPSNQQMTAGAMDGPGQDPPGGTQHAMSFDVSPSAGSTPAEPAVDSAPRAQRSERPAIPPEVREEMDAAARLADELQTQGRAVRFELEGGVAASLVDDDGTVLRSVPLTDAIDPQRLARELESDS
jgi:hypothetical protein